MGRSAAILIAILSTLALCGFACTGFGSSPGTGTIASVTGENPDPVQYTNQIADGCGAPSPYITPLATWAVKYTNGSPDNVMFTWPKTLLNGNTAVVYYYFDPVIPNNVMQDGLQAIGAWNTALQRDKKAGGTVQISLSASSSPSSAVTVYGSNDQPGSMQIGPYEGGDTLIGQIPAPYNAITGVIVLVNNNLSDNSIYASFLHELGHSLGLSHNQHQNSVMWPTLSCYVNGGQPLPPANDTQSLENTYDPYLILTTKAYKTMGCSGGVFRYDPKQFDYIGDIVPLYTLEVWTVIKQASQCNTKRRPSPISVPAQARSVALNPANDFNGRSAAASASAFAMPSTYANTSLISPVPHSNGIFGQDARRILGPSYRSNFLIDLDDHSGASTLSLSSLYLASTLVAYVQIGPVVRYHTDGPTRLAIREAKILRLLRHDLGPDSTRKVGDTVYVADYEGSHGEAFIDDLPLVQGRNAVLFLRPANSGIRSLWPSSSYRFTSRHISKMTLNSHGRLIQYSAYGSLINADLGKTDGKALSSLLWANPVNESTLEDSLLGNLLRNRNITSPLALRSYSAVINRSDHAALDWLRQTQAIRH